MAAAARLGDICTGHSPWPPRVTDEGSDNVFTNSLPAHRQGDHWVTHCAPSCHDSFLARGSSTVFINSKQAGRISDPIQCGSAVATGSPNVFIGG